MLTASQMNTLKSKIKAEMARRNGYGSLSEFSTSTYDFTNNPTSGGAIYAEQGQKTIDLLLKIKVKLPIFKREFRKIKQLSIFLRSFLKRKVLLKKLIMRIKR